MLVTDLATIPPVVLDASRLAALDAYTILDTPPEKGFDDIVHLARKVCDVPVALVSLVAGDRQWFKARVGFEPCQTTLDQSVCAHVLGQPDLLVIPDLSLDVRTRDNPLVTGAPFLRFYAGAPLRAANGEHLGSLCVIDVVPRPKGLTEDQAESLRALAGQVMAQLELRRSLAERDAMLDQQRATVVQREALLATQAGVAAAGGRLDDVLAAVVDGALRALPQAEGGVVEMREGEELVYRFGAGNLARHAGLRLPLVGSLAGACLLSGRATVVGDVLDDPNVKRDLIERLALRSCVVAPIVRGDDTIGVLKLQSSCVGAFTERDVEIVGLFAGTVSSGLAQVGEAEARRSVRAGEDRYRAVFNSAIDYAIIVMDLDGLVDDWNEGATRILGWEPAEMVRRPADVFFTPEDRADGIAAREMQAALDQGRGIDERWHLRKDGSRFWANGEMMALRDEAGTAIGFLKILRDRTEQRDAAAKLQSSEAFLRSVLDSSADCIKVLDLDARIEFMSEGGMRVMEVNAFDGVAGKDWTGFWEGSGRAEAKAAVEAALGSGVGRFAGPACTMKGTLRWWDVQVTPIHDADGAVSKLLAVSRDVTASRKAEEALLASEASQRSILETVPVGILFAEAPSGRIVGGNARIEEILGHPVLHSPGVAAYEDWRAIHADSSPVDPTDYPLARVIQGGEARAELQVRYPQRDGTETWIDIVAVPVLGPDGSVTGAVAAVSDIDARKRAEEQRDLLNGELSHRMKNLLAMVQAIAANTLRGATDIEVAKEVLADRLITLGKAHDLLLGGAAEHAAMEAVIRGAVGLQDDGSGRVHYGGPAVEIGGKASLALALMIHELATNAAKYGALSTPRGRVDIAWTLSGGDDARTLAISWHESGGVPVIAPSRKGFGTRLIERGLVGAVDGKVVLSYPADGVRCVVEAPLANFQDAL
ncbi:PAS domain S-box protein [Methylobacterium sp. J-090]|uniref:PAS domain S-box protein n=1 Tax=Methylobacterium sp. J-090 TaxID=2836666 RepID=UPI001FB99656|nr:PAS domain S-box protein [Methylobacterium sp. J-090]MCJ2084229.1 PAS domain S-box protein [Methylobacterium sp. J-090]